MNGMIKSVEDLAFLSLNFLHGGTIAA